MANRRVDSLKAKQKRQKIIAAVLGVVFLGVAAFQGPKLWKQLHPAASQANISYNEKPATTTTGTPSLAAPSLGGSETPASTGSTASPESTSAPPVADGQLSSFSLFASKDPFAQQISDSSDGSAASSGGSSGGSGSSTGSGSSDSGSGSSSSSGGSASAPKPGTAVISVNGTLYSVAVGNDFPDASSDSSVQPMFHLISVTAHSAKISIVGGSYANGAPAVTLEENKPVTLMNTADGTRYKLILKPVGTSVAASAAPTSSGSTASPTSTTSTTVTVPPPSSP
jgi:hypothetical protein